MAVVGVKGIDVGELDILGNAVAELTPGVGRSEARLRSVAGQVFEVAVLDKLGVESAVGCIVDILEEDSDEHRADWLRAGGIDTDIRLQVLKPSEAYTILLRTLGIESLAIAAMVGILLQALHRGVCHTLRPSLLLHSVDVRRDCLRWVDIRGSIVSQLTHIDVALTVPRQEVGRSDHRKGASAARQLPLAVPASIGAELHQVGFIHSLLTAPGAKVG